MKAIAMAGGEGTRLRPLTCDIPKPMVPMLDRPVISHIAELLKKHGITEMGLTLKYLSNSIIDYFEDNPVRDMEIRYFVEESPLGTAGSVKNAAEFLDGDFLVISGDCICDFDLGKAIRYHREKDAFVTIVMTRAEIPLDYGVVMTSPDGRITRFLEKPSWGEVFSNTVNTGIYILSREVLEHIPDGKPSDFSKDIFPKLLADGKKLVGYTADGYWCDIGDIEAYTNCTFTLLGKMSGENPNVYGKPAAGSPYTINPPCYIGDGVMIGDGVVLGPNAVLMDNVSVAPGASVKNSILFPYSSVGSGCEVRGTIVGRGAALKSEVRTFEGSVIGSRSTVGEFSTVRPGVKIWDGKTVESHSDLSSNVVWGCAKASLFAGEVISGEMGADMTPEFTSRVGAALGSWKRGTRIGVMTDGSDAAEILAESMVSGIRSAGGSAILLGRGFAGLLPFASSYMSLDAAAGLAVSDNTVTLSLGGGDGLPLTREDERKIESAFLREDFVRAGVSDVGERVEVPGISSIYKRELGYSTDRPLHGFCLSIGGSGDATGIMRQAMVSLGADLSERAGRGSPSAEISGDGRTVRLVDERGRTIIGEKFYALAVFAALADGGVPVLAIPFTYPSYFTELAESLGVRTVYFSSTPASGTDREARATYSAQRFLSDPLFALREILIYAAKSGLTVAEIADRIPSSFVLSEEVPVDRTRKSAVIGELIRKSDREYDLHEGARFKTSRGSVLVLPRRHGGILIRAESRDEETAKELCDFYSGEISALGKSDRK